MQPIQEQNEDVNLVVRALQARGALPLTSERRRGLEIKTYVKALDTSDAPVQEGDTVTIVGLSHSGKTQTLYLLVAGTLAGRCRDVVYIECSTPVDRVRIEQLCNSLNNTNSDNDSTSDIDDTTEARKIDHQGEMHVYRASTGLELLALLTSLHSWLRTRSGQRTGLICIDGIGAGYFGDQLSGIGRHDAIVRQLGRLVRTMPGLYLAITECALFENERVVCIPPLETALTRPGNFMTRKYRDDLVSHTIVLYPGGEGQRGALVLHGERGKHRVISGGELKISERNVLLSTLSGPTMTLTENG